MLLFGGCPSIATNKKINDTVWLSIHYVYTIILYLLLKHIETSKFKKHVESISNKESEKLLSGMLQELIKKCTT